MQTSNKIIIGIAIIFFLLVNTTYLWMGDLGFYGMILSIVLFLIFIGLSIALMVYLFMSIREKLQKRESNITTGILIIVLSLTFFMPFGLVNYGAFEAKDILIAQREGVANCTITLKLKENQQFISKDICFGISQTKGNYFVSGDTVVFEKVNTGRGKEKFYEFGILESEKEKRLILYRDKQDTVGLKLIILKYEK